MKDADFNKKEITETNIFKLTGQQLKNKTENYKGVFWCKEKQKWRAALKIHYKEVFLGYFDVEVEGAIVYNDYAIFLNNEKNTNYIINTISNYTPNPRDIPLENQEEISINKSSKYHGVSYFSNRNYFIASIKYKCKTYNLGNNKDEIECAKKYNQQALYYNLNLNTNYPLNDIPNYITIPKDIFQEIQNNKLQKKSSKYHGVTFSNQRNKFKAFLVNNKKQIHLGFFANENDAAKAYNIKAEELNKINSRQYKLNNINL
jgi:hypothetical protein